MYLWTRSQQNLITFVLVDAAFNEVLGLGGTYTLRISKNGAAFAPGVGVKAEVGLGWYSYLATAAEANTVGTISIVVTDALIKQQNLEYVVESRASNSIEFTYTVTDLGTGLPIEGVQVWFSTDIAGNNRIWYGVTDTFGAARDFHSLLPRFDPGTYYVWREKGGYIFADPDSEVVS